LLPPAGAGIQRRHDTGGFAVDRLATDPTLGRIAADVAVLTTNDHKGTAEFWGLLFQADLEMYWPSSEQSQLKHLTVPWLTVILDA
jgi:hypothetical protein